MANPEPWHLDRRVPIALILTVAIQTAGMVWWASALSSQVASHDRWIQKAEVTLARSAEDDRRTSELLGRLDERLGSLQRSIDQLARTLPSGRSN